MSKLSLNASEVSRWVSDKGDFTHNITYDLTEDSVVLDLGGYNGAWGQQIINKYNPNMYIIEPINTFFNGMVEKFKNNKKTHLLNVGISVEDGDGVIYLNGDETSTNLTNGDRVDIKLNKMSTLLNHWGLTHVDLIQINIEGDEYPLLESLIKNGEINMFNNIQVQFHMGVDDDINRRKEIHKGLMDNGFKLRFNYPFVWESWYKN